MKNSKKILIDQIRYKAENLFQTRQCLCSESIMVALNQGLDGGLSEIQAVSIAAGFPVGIGEAGCTCGALSGGVLCLGLFLNNGNPYANRKNIRKASKTLHDQFKAEFGSTCCRVLTRKIKDSPKAHFKQCAHFTGRGAEMAAKIILEKRPNLAYLADDKFLSCQNSRMGAFFITLAKLFRF